MNTRVSVIIPNYNGEETIGVCLKALYSSSLLPLEVIVVDDCSTDNSAEQIRQFPCTLIALAQHGGASRARNIGAKKSSGDILFFIDADCVVQENTVLQVAGAHERNRDCIIGGSYTPVAFDDTFFSSFQSVFINYSELKQPDPDYIATHAMVISRELFEKSGGFPEDFMPILEDVEFSHRLRRSGIRLIMDNTILVRHIFRYDLFKSLRNAFRKSKYWTAYSLTNRDLLADSGTASVELKFSVVSACLTWLCLSSFLVSLNTFFVVCMLVLSGINLYVSRKLIAAFFRARGRLFGIKATLYYNLIYPFAVAAGGAAGLMWNLQPRRKAA